MLLSAAPRSPWLVAAAFDTSPPSTAALYVFTRTDGGPCEITARVIVPAGSNDVSVVLSEAMLDGVAYTLTVSGAAATFNYSTPVRSAALDRDTPDPEVEFFGQDIAWLFGGLNGDGDCERIRGEACLENDALALGLLDKGELVQYQDRGAGALRRVNDTTSPSEMQADLESDWRKDDRVEDAAAVVVESTDGDVDFNGRIRSKAISSRQIRVSSGD